jgi:hypothetical protein
MDPASTTESPLGLCEISSLWAKAGELMMKMDEIAKTMAEIDNLRMNPV